MGIKVHERAQRLESRREVGGEPEVRGNEKLGDSRGRREVCAERGSSLTARASVGGHQCLVDGGKDGRVFGWREGWTEG